MSSVFGSLEVATYSENLMAMVHEFLNDNFPGKINLLGGIYKDDEGKFWVLPVVRQIEQQLAADLNLTKDYIHPLGMTEFCNASTNFLLGPESPSLKEGRVTTIQTLGAGGALRVGAEILLRLIRNKTVYTSAPTYSNYKALFLDTGFESFRTHRYWDSTNKSLDFAGMIEDLRQATENSVIILQACAHNPTGVDPTREQWRQIADVVEERRLFPFFDVAYQGFASGDVDDDIWPVRYFDSRGIEMIVAHTYSKMCGLYSERVGSLMFLSRDPSVITPLRSHLFDIIRSSYSHPAAHGAHIVTAILTTPGLSDEWKTCIRKMYDRLVSMRQALRKRLEELGTPGTWDHITNQTGMFCFIGLNPEALKKLAKDHHIYVTTDEGRMSLTGLNSGNVDYVAQCIHQVVMGN